MQPCHSNPKEFEKRTEIESKKVKALASAFEKAKKAMDTEKKAYCNDFKKAVDSYAVDPYLSPGLAMIIKRYSQGLDKMSQTYETSMEHITDVPCNALGYLPKKYDNYKKSIKVSDKMPEGLHKIKDYEFERIQYTRQSLLHYLNA